MGILHLNDSNFRPEISSSTTPVLVDFWAEWCTPCKRVSPIVEQLAVEYEGKVKIAKVNVEEGKRTATDLGVMSIPTFILFKGGKVVKQIVGAITKDELKAAIESNI